MASKTIYKNANGINAEVTLVNPDTNFNKRTVELNSIMDKTPTIATLRAKTEIPETIYVTGYHSEGDGAFGSHFFRWNPNSMEDDNGGTIIKLDSVETGRYELQYDGAVNVKWFGDTAEYDILIVYGQSNAVGYAQDPDYAPTPSKQSFYWNGTAIVPLIMNMTHSSGDVSTGNAWVAWCNTYTKETGRKVVVIPCAKGETSIQELSKGDISGWYNLMSNYVNNVKTTLGTKLGKIWVAFHQGEQDQLNGTTWITYRDKLNALVADMKVDFSYDKFIIHYCGFPRNRPEQNWFDVINAQRYVAQFNNDVVCGYADAQSFKRENFTLNSDTVHYALKGLNIMGEHSAKVAVGLIKNDKSYDISGDRDMFGLGLAKDRSWTMFAATLLNEDGLGWALSTRANSISDDALANIVSIVDDTANARLLVNISGYAEDYIGLSVRKSALAEEKGLSFVASRINSTQIAIEAFWSGTFLVDTAGVVKSASGVLPDGNGGIPQFIVDNITVLTNSTQERTITFSHAPLGGIMVAPYANSSSISSVANNPRLRMVDPTQAKVYLDSGDYQAYIIQVSKVKINITNISGMGRLQISGIGGYSGAI